MEKRYQVFVSSTFVDLQEARGKVMQTLMEMDCIPAGMELFPAMDEEQIQFIKRVIDDCDYYLLIVGGRYGSVSAEGISFTEMEYDYAIEKGLKVLAFVHEHPENLPAKFTDSAPELRDKLDAFRNKVMSGRLVRLWSDLKELPGLVALSLTKTIKTYPAIGWVRADRVSNDEALKQQTSLLKEIETLRQRLAQPATGGVSFDGVNLAGMSEPLKVKVRWQYWREEPKSVVIDTTWGELFRLCSPDIQVNPSDAEMQSNMGKSLLSTINLGHTSMVKVDNEAFKTIRIHLTALGYIQTNNDTTSSGQRGLIWSLTDLGYQLMLKERAVKITGETNQ